MTFDEFVAFRLGALLRYATVVTCDAHLAEDITQDVLVRAQARWGRIGSVDAPERYSGQKLTVVGQFPREELIAVAAGIEIGAAPDLAWLGATTR